MLEKLYKKIFPILNFVPPELAHNLAIKFFSNFKKKITDIRIGKYNFSIYNCTKCGIRRTYPILTKKEIESFHDVGHYRDEEGKRFKFVISRINN